MIDTSVQTAMIIKYLLEYNIQKTAVTVEKYSKKIIYKTERMI